MHAFLKSGKVRVAGNKLFWMALLERDINPKNRKRTSFRQNSAIFCCERVSSKPILVCATVTVWTFETLWWVIAAVLRIERYLCNYPIPLVGVSFLVALQRTISKMEIAQTGNS